jgi:hypothetical protein
MFQIFCVGITIFGLLSCTFSVYEISKVRKYRAEVQDFQRKMSEISEWEKEWAKSRHPNVVQTVMIGPPIELNDGTGLEKGWWVVGSLAWMLWISGVVGFVMERRGGIRKRVARLTVQTQIPAG